MEFSDRDRISQQYAEQNGLLPETNEEAKEAPKEEAKPVETPTERPPEEAEKQTETPEEEKTDEPVKTESEIRKEQEKAENLKKALDEERGKRKRLREEKEALEARVREYESKQEPPKEPDPIADYDAELNAVKAKLRSIELMEARREESARQELIRQQQQKLNDMKKKTASELAEEGYPGFEYMAGAVTEYLVNLASQGKEEYEQAEALDNPNGWKQIFKENIYPNFHKQAEETTRKRSLEEKKNLKKEANLNTTPGKAPKKEPDDDPNTWSAERKYQESLKIRRRT